MRHPGPQTAEIALDIDGATRTFKADGNGPVDAIFNAIVTLVPHKACWNSTRCTP